MTLFGPYWVSPTSGHVSTMYIRQSNRFEGFTMINTTYVERRPVAAPGLIPKETWGKCQGHCCQYVGELGNGLCMTHWDNFPPRRR